MRIAIVAPVNYPELASYLTPHDAEIAASHSPASATAPTTLALALIRDGHDVTMVTHGDGAPPLRLVGDQLEVIRVRSRARGRHRFKDLWRVERSGMTSALRDGHFDVVHGHWAYEHALSALSSRLPTAITIRDAPATVWRYAPDLERGIKYSMALTTAHRSRRAALAAVSPYMADAWRRQTRFAGAVDIVPNTVSLPPHDAVPKAPFPLLTEVADGGPRKNAMGLLRAFALARKAVPEARLQFFGRGLDSASEIAEFARLHSLDASVEFRGLVPRAVVTTEIRRSWAHVHASEEESFGNTILESLAVGTVVVGGAASGAVPWLLDAGRAGILADVRSEEALSSALVQVLQDDGLREELAIEGAARADALFSTRAVLDCHYMLYERAVWVAKSYGIVPGRSQ